MFYGENVSCKFVTYKKNTDSNYFDTFSIGQSFYVPNAKNNTLTVIQPNEPVHKTVASGCLHSWCTKRAFTETSGTIRKHSGDLPERAARKHKTSAHARTPPVEEPAVAPYMWLSWIVSRERGLFQCSSVPESQTVLESLSKHVETIENEGGFSS